MSKKGITAVFGSFEQFCVQLMAVSGNVHVDNTDMGCLDDFLV